MSEIRSNKRSYSAIESDDESEQVDGELRRLMASQVEELPRLSRAEKDKHIAKIQQPLDACLQMVIWAIGCNYVLYDHQFAGVRLIAGVSSKFPYNIRTLEETEEQIDEILETAKERRRRGLIMADVMGK